MRRIALWLGGALVLLLALLLVTTGVASAQDCTRGQSCEWDARTEAGRAVLYPYDTCECVQKEVYYYNDYEKFQPLWQTEVFWEFEPLNDPRSKFEITQGGSHFICYDVNENTTDCQQSDRGPSTFLSPENTDYELKRHVDGDDAIKWPSDQPEGKVIFWEARNVPGDLADDVCSDAQEYYQIGGTEDGALEFAGDQDWHLLQVSAGQSEVHIELQVPPLRDYELEIRSDDCQSVIYRSDSPEAEPGGHPSNDANVKEEFYLWNAAANTKYRLHVYEFGASDALHESGGYVVTTNYARTDTLAPSCTAAVVPDLIPEQFIYTIQDTGSGIAEILVTQMWNVTLSPPPNADNLITEFEFGTNDVLNVIETQVDMSYGGISDLRVTDRAGNAVACDPPLYLPLLSR